MSRLIDADALIIALKRKMPISDSMRVMMAECLAEVRHAPTIEPERGKGRWIDDGTYGDYHPHHAWHCSECEESVIEIGTPWFKFCLNCGADMRGEKND